MKNKYDQKDIQELEVLPPNFSCSNSLKSNGAYKYCDTKDDPETSITHSEDISVIISSVTYQSTLPKDPESKTLQMVQSTTIGSMRSSLMINLTAKPRRSFSYPDETAYHSVRSLRSLPRISNQNEDNKIPAEVLGSIQHDLNFKEIANQFYSSDLLEELIDDSTASNKFLFFNMPEDSTFNVQTGIDDSIRDNCSLDSSMESFEYFPKLITSNYSCSKSLDTTEYEEKESIDSFYLISRFAENRGICLCICLSTRLTVDDSIIFYPRSIIELYAMMFIEPQSDVSRALVTKVTPSYTHVHRFFSSANTLKSCIRQEHDEFQIHSISHSVCHSCIRLRIINASMISLPRGIFISFPKYKSRQGNEDNFCDSYLIKNYSFLTAYETSKEDIIAMKPLHELSIEDAMPNIDDLDKLCDTIGSIHISLQKTHNNVSPQLLYSVAETFIVETLGIQKLSSKYTSIRKGEEPRILNKKAQSLTIDILTAKICEIQWTKSCQKFPKASMMKIADKASTELNKWTISNQSETRKACKSEMPMILRYGTFGSQVPNKYFDIKSTREKLNLSLKEPYKCRFYHVCSHCGCKFFMINDLRHHARGHSSISHSMDRNTKMRDDHHFKL